MYRVVCSCRSVLAHDEGTMQASTEGEERSERRRVASGVSSQRKKRRGVTESSVTVTRRHAPSKARAQVTKEIQGEGLNGDRK
jgi:hypothetical protein